VAWFDAGSWRQGGGLERAAELKGRALAVENRTALAKEHGISRQWVSAIARGSARSDGRAPDSS
jgi:hypothetical protein